MQGLIKLAGVEEASQQPSGIPPNFPEPPPIPPDVEAQTTLSLHSRPSRSSLPVRRKSSRRTLHERPSGTSLRPPSQPNAHGRGGGYTASAHSRDTASQFTEGDMPWGPMHPCFPHLNPHVATSSPEYAATRVIRVQRDWLVGGDLYPALQNLYPEILADHVSEAEFRAVVETLNPLLRAAFGSDSARAWLDAALGVLTGFLWDNLGFTGAQRKVAAIEDWVARWNREAQIEGREARLVHLRRTGFMTLDIQIPDPRIDVLDADVHSM